MSSVPVLAYHYNMTPPKTNNAHKNLSGARVIELLQQLVAEEEDVCVAFSCQLEHIRSMHMVELLTTFTQICNATDPTIDIVYELYEMRDWSCWVTKQWLSNWQPRLGHQVGLAFSASSNQMIGERKGLT